MFRLKPNHQEIFVAMKPDEAKNRLREIETELAKHAWVLFETFTRGGRTLHLGLTERFRKKARKAGIWSSPHMFSALKNAAYGFDEHSAAWPQPMGRKA